MVQSPFFNLWKVLKGGAVPPLNATSLKVFLKCFYFAQNLQMHFNIWSLYKVLFINELNSCLRQVASYECQITIVDTFGCHPVLLKLFGSGSHDQVSEKMVNILT